MNHVEILKGTVDDIQELGQLYDKTNEYLASGRNYPGWIKGIYPIRKDAEIGISSNCLYVAKINHVIVGSIILGHDPEPAYDQAEWKIEADDYSSIYVIRTLVVNPDYQKNGIGEALMEFATELARREGISSIRLDVYENNAPAIRLYEKLGYQYIDLVDLGYGVYGLDYFKLYELVL